MGPDIGTVPTLASGGVNLRFALLQNPPPPKPSQRLAELGAGGMGVNGEMAAANTALGGAANMEEWLKRRLADAPPYGTMNGAMNPASAAAAADPAGAGGFGVFGPNAAETLLRVSAVSATSSPYPWESGQSGSSPPRERERRLSQSRASNPRLRPEVGAYQYTQVECERRIV